MELDNNSITSLVSIFAVFITLIFFIIETRHSNLSLKTDLLFKLQEKFDSSEFRQIRASAAKKLINNEMPNYELSNVLDFFASIGFLYDRHAIDQDLTYQNFSFWMIRYWFCSEEYILHQRETYPGLRHLEKLTEIMHVKELKDGYPALTKELSTQFLLEEVGNNFFMDN